MGGGAIDKKADGLAGLEGFLAAGNLIRRRQRQRRHPVDLLTGNPERLPAGRQQVNSPHEARNRHGQVVQQSVAIERSCLRAPPPAIVQAKRPAESRTCKGAAA